MTQDYAKKTLRQFECREYLWNIFAQMGLELDHSTDYLINDAMRQYARTRRWGMDGNAAKGPARASGDTRGAPRRSLDPGAASRTTLLPRAPRLPASERNPDRASRPPRVSIPPLPPGAARTEPHAQAPSLYLIFDGRKLPVNKKEFVIGRGSNVADLPIRDRNISRRHAAVVLEAGNFYLRDLGSTNGIEFHGERVGVRRIENGDVYRLCDHELRFSFD